jgi:hypothetical protein
MAGIGLADPRFILINGDYWQSNEKRRPIVLQAWYAQFADYLLDHLRNKFPNHKTIQNLKNKGAHDVLVRVHNLSRTVFPTLSIIKHTKAKKALYVVKEHRNFGTHEKIKDLEWLKEMLQGMIEFCESSGIQEEKLLTFKRNCQRELKQLRIEPTLY